MLGTQLIQHFYRNWNALSRQGTYEDWSTASRFVMKALGSKKASELGKTGKWPWKLLTIRMIFQVKLCYHIYLKYICQMNIWLSIVLPEGRGEQSFFGIFYFHGSLYSLHQLRPLKLQGKWKETLYDPIFSLKIKPEWPSPFSAWIFNGEWQILGLAQRIYKMSLEHLIVSENKKHSKNKIIGV